MFETNIKEEAIVVRRVAKKAQSALKERSP